MPYSYWLHELRLGLVVKYHDDSEAFIHYPYGNSRKKDYFNSAQKELGKDGEGKIWSAHKHDDSWEFVELYGYEEAGLLRCSDIKKGPKQLEMFDGRKVSLKYDEAKKAFRMTDV